jgi:hypothetical protein
VVELLRSSCPQLVTTATSVREMRALGDECCGHVERVVAGCPLLSADMDSLLSAAQRAIEAREQNLALLRHQPHLLELFEVPSLMDTCIRSNLIDEVRAPRTRPAARALRGARARAPACAIVRLTACARRPPPAAAWPWPPSAQALELRATLHAICAAHADVVVLARVQAEVECATAVLHAQLLATLERAGSLPEALAAVWHLRRMALLDERALRAAFLSGRTAQLTADWSCAEREQREPHRLALRLLQLSRERWFDTLTQYEALFGAGGAAEQPADAAGGGAAGADAVLDVRGWLVGRALELRGALGALLLRIDDAASLQSALEQAYSASAALARVGGEFAPIVLPSFERALSRLFERALTLTRRHWVGALGALRRAAAADPRARLDVPVSGLNDDAAARPPTQPPADVAAPLHAAGADAGARRRRDARDPRPCASRPALTRAPPRPPPRARAPGRAAAGAPLAPPRCAMRWRPLGILVNTVLNALNELRKCALLTIEPQLRAALGASLRECFEQLERLRAERSPPDALADAVRSMSGLLLESVLPFFDAALDALFGRPPPPAPPAGVPVLHRPGQLTRMLAPQLAPLAAPPPAPPAPLAPPAPPAPPPASSALHAEPMALPTVAASAASGEALEPVGIAGAAGVTPPPAADAVAAASSPRARGEPRVCDETIV